MREGANVNNVAMGAVKIVYHQVLYVRCFSHTLGIIGDKFKIHILTSFVSYWVSLFAHSPKTKTLWKAQTGMAAATYSKTRKKGND